jgi:hypothetical protein
MGQKLNTMAKSITLQINAAPTDNRFIEKIISHQINAIGSQVDVIRITADIRPSKKGRFSFSDEQIEEFKTILADFENRHKNLMIDYVDYSDEMIKTVSDTIWGDELLPVKDYRGGPFYSYMFGLYMVDTDYVFHLDSDIFLGGGYQDWCSVAKELLADDPLLAIIKPLSGPPKKDRSAPNQFGELLYPYRDLPNAFYSDNFTTRVYFTKKSRLLTILRNLSLESPDLIRSLLGRWQRNPAVKAPEQLLSNYLKETNYFRLDFLGAEPGLWALHPPFRSDEFYEKLDHIIHAVETGDIPNKQRGFYDINSAFVDWSRAIDELPVYRRKKARRRYL